MTNRHSRHAKNLQEMVNDTKENMHEAEQTLKNGALPEEEKEAIKEKNVHRQESIAAFEQEIKEEQHDLRH